MIEAQFYDKLPGQKVRCRLCPNNCIIIPGKRGSCRVRENKSGKLYSMVYGLPVAASVDPVEKKPLFHFLPGTKTYSIATAGCNFHCKYCQNWQISQKSPEEVQSFSLTPKDVVANAKRLGCRSISYTYTEPTVFYEYVLATAKLAKAAGLKNIVVTNGYINLPPLRKLYRHVDAVNVDIKSWSEKFYAELCQGKLKPVLSAVKEMKKLGCWVEVTTLLIPGINDSLKDIKMECDWIKKELGSDVPLHFSRYFPHFKLQHVSPTPEETIFSVVDYAKRSGLRYVYVGNVDFPGGESTFCPKCQKRVLDRHTFTVSSNRIANGKCGFCNTRIAGIWK